MLICGPGYHSVHDEDEHIISIEGNTRSLEFVYNLLEVVYNLLEFVYDFLEFVYDFLEFTYNFLEFLYDLLESFCDYYNFFKFFLDDLKHTYFPSNLCFKKSNNAFCIMSVTSYPFREGPINTTGLIEGTTSYGGTFSDCKGKQGKTELAWRVDPSDGTQREMSLPLPVGGRISGRINILI